MSFEQRQYSPVQAMVLWFCATSLVGTLTWAAVAITGMLTIGLVLFIALTLLGLLIGITQRLLLDLLGLRHETMLEYLRWPLLTAIGATLAWYTVFALRAIAVSIEPDTLLHPLLPAIIFAVGGFLFGLAQLLALGSRIRHSSWWLLSNILGWSIGAYLGFRYGSVLARDVVPLNNPPTVFGPAEATQIFFVGVTVIVFYSLTTSIALPTLLKSMGLSAKALV